MKSVLWILRLTSSADQSIVTDDIKLEALLQYLGGDVNPLLTLNLRPNADQSVVATDAGRESLLQHLSRFGKHAVDPQPSRER